MTMTTLLHFSRGEEQMSWPHTRTSAGSGKPIAVLLSVLLSVDLGTNRQLRGNQSG